MDKRRGVEQDDARKNGGDYEEPKLPSAATAPTAVNHSTNKVSSDDDDDISSADDEDEESVYTNTPSNKPVTAPPPQTLFTVQATHKYTQEDEDELSFEQGDVIYIVQFENPEEQDDGWQMGIKQSDGAKGVFPENFTRRI